MRRFLLVRNKDISGVSGTGVVAEGVEFSNGTTILSWRGDLTSVEMTRNLETCLKIHGHEGSTVVEWVDPEPLPEIKVNGQKIADCHGCGAWCNLQGDIYGPCSGAVKPVGVDHDDSRWWVHLCEAHWNCE